MTPDWQPIASAPTDFGWMYCWDGESLHIVCRLDGQLLAVVIDRQTMQPALIEWPMTHWMPLPDPPVSASPDQET